MAQIRSHISLGKSTCQTTPRGAGGKRRTKTNEDACNTKKTTTARAMDDTKVLHIVCAFLYSEEVPALMRSADSGERRVRRQGNGFG
jgi:hypothetical protein